MLEKLKEGLVPEAVAADLRILKQVLEAQNDALKVALDRLSTVEAAHAALAAEHKVTQDALLAQGNVVLAHRDVLTRWAAESATLRDIEEKHAKQMQRDENTHRSLQQEAIDGVIRMESKKERRARRSREHQERIAKEVAPYTASDVVRSRLLARGTDPDLVEGIIKAAHHPNAILADVPFTDAPLGEKYSSGVDTSLPETAWKSGDGDE